MAESFFANFVDDPSDRPYPDPYDALAKVRRALAALRAPAQQTPEREALQRIKDICAGDRVPNWKDDWQTTHSRGRILDICDGALALPSTLLGTEPSAPAASDSSR